VLHALDRHALDRSDTTAQLQRLSVADPQSGYAAWFQGGHGPVGLPISHRCPQGSVMRPSRQPCSSLTGEVTVAPAPDAASTTASGSSTTSRVRLVPPPSQLGGTAHSRRQRWRSRSGVAHRQLGDDVLAVTNACATTAPNAAW